MRVIRFSVITPVFDPELSDFQACARSVLNQTAIDWEWIIADDGSTDEHILRYLAELAADPRITLTRLERNSGIAAATNAATERAHGEFLVFLDHDDELTLEALDIVSEAIDAHCDVDMLYSDEAKIDPSGGLYDWFAKPDWSPERLRSQNYINHLTVLRTALVRDLGGIRQGFDGAQDHDLVLRVSERARQIVHVPLILYKWRATARSTASGEHAKPQAADAGRRAVHDHLQRVGIDADVTPIGWGRYRWVRRVHEQPKVSIVIPTRGDSKRVRGCPLNLVVNAVESVVTTTTYHDVEFVVVYDHGTPESVLDRLRELARDSLVLVEFDEPFHFSRKTNLGVSRSNGDILVMLNDDTEAITPDWIETLVGLVTEPDVGMVGPMLLLADGRIQSAGHHYAPTPFQVGAGASPDDPGPHALFAIAGERSGVTAACAAVRRDVFFEMGGLSERFPNCYNDVDLGFKLLAAGYRIVWTPHAKMYHFESLTRDTTESLDEANELQQRWGRHLGDDSYTKQMDLWWADVPFVPPDTERRPR